MEAHRLVVALTGCLQLEELYIDDCKNFVEPQITFQLPRLHTLSAMRSTLNSQGIVNWLRAAPGVQTLCLHQALWHGYLSDVGQRVSAAATDVVDDEGRDDHEVKMKRTTMGYQYSTGFHKHPLQKLDLGHTPTDDSTISALLSLQHNTITSLNVQNCTAVTGSVLWTSKAAALRSLNLAFTSVTDANLTTLWVNMYNLEHLSLKSCNELHQPVIQSNTIQTVDFDVCRGMNSLTIAQGCHALNTVKLSFCLNLKTIKGLKVVPSMRVLQMRDCHRSVFASLFQEYKDDVKFKPTTKAARALEPSDLRGFPDGIFVTYISSANISALRVLLDPSSASAEDNKISFDESLIRMSADSIKVSKTLVDWQWQTDRKDDTSWKSYDKNLNHFLEACWRVRKYRLARKARDPSYVIAPDEQVRITYTHFQINTAKYEVDLGAVPIIQANLQKGSIRQVRRVLVDRGEASRDFISDSAWM
jgi:hypothetical protein